MVASQHRAVAGPAAQDRRAGGGRGLWRPVDGAGAGALGRRGDGAGARRLRRRRQHAQRRRRQRRHDAGQGLLRQGRAQRSRGMEEGDVAHAERRCRFAGPGRDGDPARRHRVLLAHERPLQRRLHAQALRRAGGQGRHLQCQCRARHLHGAARAAARGDRVGLLLRRHGGGTHRPASSGAVLRRPSQGHAQGRRPPVRAVRRREDRAQSRRLHRARRTRARSRRARW